MIITIIPDRRGRVSIKKDLNSIKWKYGQGVEIDIRKTVTLPKEE